MIDPKSPLIPPDSYTISSYSESATNPGGVVRRRQLHPNLFGRPIEEVDPFVFHDTFCLISKKLGKYYIYRFSASKSLFIFGPLNPVRKLACRIITNTVFDLFIMMVILINCVTLAMETNLEDGISGNMKRDEAQERIIDIFEFVYLGLYTMEMVLEVVAKGFLLNKFSYLRSFWSVLDFFVIVSSYAAIPLQQSKDQEELDLDFIPALRVLRAIKTISIIPGLRVMINSLLKSVKTLVEVMILTMFFLLIMSLVALQLYNGKLLQKCVLVKDGPAHRKMIYELFSRDGGELGAINSDTPNSDKLWYEWVKRQDNWLMRKDGYPKEEFVPCGNGSYSRQCPEGYVCLENLGESFDEGWTNFDNYFTSMLVTFQLLTTDFWERPYDLILSSTSPLSVFFCIVVIYLGFYYLLNLMLAVVAESYEEEYHQSTTVPMTKHQKLSVNRESSAFSFDDPTKLKITVMTFYKKRSLSEREMLARTIHNPVQSFHDQEVVDLDVDGKKQPYLQNAILTLLGHRVSAITEAKSARQSTQSNVLKNDESNETGEHTEIENSTKNVQAVGNNLKEQRGGEIDIERVSSIMFTTIRQPTQCRKFFNNITASLKNLVVSKVFEIAITVIIICNTILLASEHYGQPEWLRALVAQSNHVFTGMFLIEAILKISALRKEYFSSWWNNFDLLIVIFSVMDSVSDFLQLGQIAFGVRVFRLLRVFKLAQSWLTMKVLLNIIFSTFGALGNLTLVLVLVLYMFAILGLQTVGKYYTRRAFKAEDDEDRFPRWNFQDFRFAFLLTFRVLCGEWIEPMFECFEATAEKKQEAKCLMLFLPIFIIGNLIILNLFLALLLNSFDTEQLESEREKELEASGKKSEQIKRQVVQIFLSQKALNDRHSGDIIEHPIKVKDRDNDSHGRARFRKIAKRVIIMNRKAVAEKMIETATLKRKQQKSTRLNVRGNALIADRQSSFGLTGSESGAGIMSLKEGGSAETCIPKKCYGSNCCVGNWCRRCKWSAWDDSRVFSYRIVSHPIFEWTILALILASSITLCFEDVELDNRKELKDALFYINTTFTIIFIMEMLIKWFALGLWNYFTSSWTILDFFIVVVSVISWRYGILDRLGGNPKGKKSQLSAFKALRTLRALRPLRAISRWQGMKIVVNALMFAIPSIVNVLLVCLLFWLVFAILGVQLFKGKFHRCVDNDSGDTVVAARVKTKEECCNNTNQWSWVNQTPNFDNVFQGYLTLFQVALFEGWMEAMQASVDATEIGSQPDRDNNVSAYIFYVIFIVFGSFFTLNLFIGVIIDNFNRLKKKYEGNLVEALLTPSQRNYYTAMKKLGRKKPRKVIKRPKHALLALFYDISMSRRFEIAIFILIFLNMFILALEQYKMRGRFKDMLSGFNFFFATVYALEAIVKIVGLRQYYFTILWNFFDFALVVGSVAEIALVDIIGEDAFPFPPTMLRIVRVFRLGRVLRLIKAAKGIRKLLFALIVSLPALFNIGALLFLIIFIYAILGMGLFANTTKNEAIDEMFNFDTFLRSCLMLLRVMTMAAGWNDVVEALTIEEPICGTYRNIECGDPEHGECPSFGVAVLYFVSFILITHLIVINMYVAIILENFYDASREEEVGIVEDDLEMFYAQWARYDPQATQFISFDQLSEFLSSLDRPLGVPRPNIVAIVAFNLPIARGNKIHCLDVLHALVKHVIGHVEDTEDFRKLQEQMEHKFRKQFPTRKLLDIISSTRVWKIQHNAAVIIQRAWRAHRARRLSLEQKSKQSIAGGGQYGGKGRLTKMGNLLHLSHKDKGPQKRRLSINP